MSAEQRKKDRFLALNPANSVAVEACAGSGKTWLLASRLLRLLLAGVRPGEILAITYTRKAAREIEARLRLLLAQLACASDEEALQMLCDRGLTAAEAVEQLPRARGLLELVLHAEPAMTVSTFHGWFARLLGAAPLDSGLAGRTLDSGASSLLEEAWGLLAADCGREPEGGLAQSLLHLYAKQGAHNTRKLIKAFIERRAEWRVWQTQCGGSEGVLNWLAAEFGANAELLENLFGPARLDELESFARLCGQNTSTDQLLGNKLAQAVVDLREAGFSAVVREDARFEAVRDAFLTQSDAPRATRKASAAQSKRLGDAGAEQFLSLHTQWSERLLAVLDALRDRACEELNQHALCVGEALLAKLDDLKQQRRAMDFSDLEAEVDNLLSREGSAAYVQARLDARYKHILLDEFQDTNPLQWRILRGWLDAYGESGAARPSVFLVGDPKQSIYRFRRAEPKLFKAAIEYFKKEFGAQYINNAHTFRNAQGVVDLVNTVFRAEPLFDGFVEQSAERADWPARVELLPLIPVPDSPAETPVGAGFRLPLEEPAVEAEDVRRSEEAALLARRISEMFGCWQVCGKDGHARSLRYSDVLILTRRKTQLAIYEAALRDAGIPFVSPGQGGLLETLEAQDLLATLRWLADPADDLALAQVLRAPAFHFADEDLLNISAVGGSWWPALCDLAQQDAGHLRRAVRLLGGWLSAAAHLPAHDLIDRIFHEADWFERCRAVLPPALWPGVQSNLEALLELSLNVDAGRYPSLTRFVDEMRRLSVSDDEAPDEGLIAAAGEGQGRVRIMTIHGAKGLEAPVVWLIDANSPARGAEGFDVAMNWPAEASAPGHFSLLAGLKEAAPAQREILEAEKLASEREELNLLYVAITRAEQVFIVSGVETARAARQITPYKRLAQALGTTENGWVCGELPCSDVISSAPAATESGIRPRPVVSPVGKQRLRQEPTQEAAGQAFGTAMHAWLEAHCAHWPLPVVSAEVERAARNVIERPGLARFFDPVLYSRAGNETAFLDANGVLRRIDRWVDCEDAIWVLDYKSGKVCEDALLAAYRAQIADYREVLRTIFPDRPVKALLVFSDGGEVVVE